MLSVLEKLFPVKAPARFLKSSLLKALFFSSDLRRSCGEPEGQILQIRFDLLLRFYKSTLPPGSYDAHQVSTYAQPALFLRPKWLILFNTENCSSECFAKWSPTKGKHGAHPQRIYRSCRQADSGDKDLTAEQWGGCDTCRGLQRTQVPQDSHRPGGNPEPPTSRWGRITEARDQETHRLVPSSVMSVSNQN